METIHIVADNIEKVAVDDLKVEINQVKNHPPDQIALLAGMIKEFGFTTPLLIDQGNNVIAGRGRLLAAKKLEMEFLPCVRTTHLSKAQIKALIIADNKVAESEWNYDALQFEIDGIKELDEDLLALTGFNFEELDDMLDGGLTEECDDGEDLPKLHFLTVDKHKIELTPEERNDLQSHISGWVKHYGSNAGFVRHLLECLENAKKD